MRLCKFKPRILVALVVSLLIVLIGLLINWALDNVNDAVINATLSEMSEIGAQVEQSLEETLAESKNDLMYLADYIVKQDIPSEDIGEFLATQSQTEQYDTLYYVDLNGNGVSLTGETYDFSENETFLYALQNEFFIAEPHLSQLSNEMVFDISVPVARNGEVIAVLYTEAPTSRFLNILENSSANTGELYIVDYDLKLAFSTSENQAGESFVVQGNITDMGLENITKAQADMKAKRSGGFYYDYDGVPKVIVYFPIENTEWSLVMNVEVAAINSILTTAVDSTETVSRIIYWGVIFLVLYISIVKIRSDKKLIKTAYYDPLTNLANTAKLKLEMTTALEQNKKKQYSIIVFDIENFKAINEKFGYAVGDRVLRAIKTFSDSFNEPSLLTARIGGDKFAMFAYRDFLGDISVLTQAVPEHFDTHIPELRDYSGTFKIGRYHIEPKESDYDDIMAKVNLALVRAKATKGEVLCDYDDTLKSKVRMEAEITNKMKLALDSKEFNIYLQPKFSTYGKELVGAEALVRWIEADGKMIFPNDFIPLFERNGFIVELDQYMLENVCIVIKNWINAGFKPIGISVNCSRLNLENPYFVDGVVAIVDKYHVPHECIEIELTESATIENEHTIEQFFDDLRKHKFKISIDDFGAGFSSLGMLKNLHVDTLKMDRAFFVGGKNKRRDDMLVDSIVKLSHSLGMCVVAEGIETHEQVELLRDMNCDAIQGYVYAKPMSIREFEDTYKNVLCRKTPAQNDAIPLMQNINDMKFANSLVPCGILITEIDEHFTMVEANKSYFDIVGLTSEEIRDVYKNRGLDMIEPQDRAKAVKYFGKQMKEGSDDLMEFVCQTITKDGTYKTVQLKGVMATNETGQQRLYFSVSDITDYARIMGKIKRDKVFVSNIASLMNDSYFDFDNTSKTIRFSKTFADKFHVPEIIENFFESDIRTQMFPNQKNTLDRSDNTEPKLDGQFCMMLPSGDPVWYTYHCEYIYDENNIPYRTVGKLTELMGNKLESDVERVKAEADLFTSVYNSQAIEKYISSYLEVAFFSNSIGALLAIKLNHLVKLYDVFGCRFVEECLADIGKLLLNTFKETDLIGRMDQDTFLVFIGNCKTTDIAKEKAAEICEKLCKMYEKEESHITVTASVGISFYPEHGRNFNGLYEKATLALMQAKTDECGGFSTYKQQ